MKRYLWLGTRDTPPNADRQIALLWKDGDIFCCSCPSRPEMKTPDTRLSFGSYLANIIIRVVVADRNP